MKILKGLVPVILGAAMVFCLVACGSSTSSSSASNASQGSSSSAAAAGSANSDKHVIGVAVYDVGDDEVSMFREYLVDYISKVCFEDVQFVYSSSISSEEEMLDFIDDVAALGGEGLMSFYNIDLQAEVERCAEHGMYHMVASGTVSEEDFAKVEDNEYFLGAVGPMIQMEYTAGSNMVTNYIAHKVGDRYFIMSGGAAMNNEMHYQRTLGMLDMLESSYGVDLGDTKTLAATAEPQTLTVDNLTVTIAPGYVAIDSMMKTVTEAFKASEYDVVLSTIPVDPIIGTLNATDVKIAMVDCYSQANQLLFASGKLDYLVGKYGSLVGPSFAAMYNAVTGHAADFRDNGKAFKIVQNFWSSDSKADFDEKYLLASNITTPAYNYEDLYSVCVDYTPTATLDDLRTLAQACSYKEAKERRGL